jgi:hypothetical protein
MAGDAAADAALRDLDLLERRLRAEVLRILARMETQRGSDRLLADREALDNATRVYRQLQGVLVRQGVAAVRDATFARALEAAELASAPLPVPADARDALRAIVTGQTADVAKLFGEGADAIRQAIAVRTATAQTLGSLLDEVSEALDTTLGKARSAVNTAVLSAGRTAAMEANAAAFEESGLDGVWVTSGPLDSITRPFCLSVRGFAYSDAALDKLDNGQGLPVRQSHGGYNCRHDWTLMTVEEARASGLVVVR